ncbi:MAG: cytochrome P450, partial [Acidimicrobiales bacterium]|nr:cytochrome P450 [Acidimicrobiales bacterium]
NASVEKKISSNSGLVDFGPSISLEAESGLFPGESFHDCLRSLRDSGPVVPAAILGIPCHLITRYAELESAFSDNDGFPAGPTYAASIEPCQGVTFESTDGDEHNTLRSLATQALRARPIGRFADSDIAPIADALIDDFLDDGGGDLVELFTSKFPFYVFGRRMGLPDDLRDEYYRWSFDILGFPRNPQLGLSAAAELTSYVEPVLTQRRQCPSDDMLSSMIISEKGGRSLTNEEILSHVRAIFAAGASTTHHGLGNTLYALLTNDEAMKRLRATPEMIPLAVDEMLRWEPPIGVLPRLVPFDTVVAGENLSVGEIVLMGIASANRDERMYTNPDVFDVEREPQRVLTFGLGSHHCPGTHLAKAQISVGIERLLARLPNLHSTNLEISQPVGCILRGPISLPVAWA